jgi:hypothetical protein
MLVQLPERTNVVKPLYYDTFYAFIKQWMQLAGNTVELTHSDTVFCGTGNFFSCTYNSHQIIFDYGDAKECATNPENYKCPYFKFHYCRDVEYANNVVPFVPMLSLDWFVYKEAQKSVHYTAEGKISCKQRPYGNALIRRNKVISHLKARYANEVDTKIVPQGAYWQSFNDCFVSVCVPGQREDILDRGQIEAMGLGVCTISPIIKEELLDTRMEPFVHYVPVENGFSDLDVVIEWCRSNKEKCIEIGTNAKSLIDSIYTPWVIESWIGFRVRH